MGADLFSCPACLLPLEGGDSVLSCRRCGGRYPVVRGIPRFVESQAYAGTFGFEWRRYEVQKPEEDDEFFRVKTGWTPDIFKGKSVLDAGCGSGRYSAVAARWGARVYSMDLSLAVEKAAEVNRGLGPRVAQGDLLHPPFAPGTFDFVFSIGVLHHTPDTRRAFDSIARLVKPGGQLAVWIYRKNTWPQEALNSALRALTTRLPAGLLEKLCHVPAFLAGVPVLNKVLGRVVNLGNTHPDWTIRLCDAYDWYSPRYQYHHTPAEVKGWFEAAGFKDVRELLPQRRENHYLWMYRKNLIIGSGVNFVGECPHKR